MVLLTQEPSFWHRTRLRSLCKHATLKDLRFWQRGWLTYLNQNIQMMNKEKWTFYVRKLAPASAASHTCIVVLLWMVADTENYFNNVLTTFLGLEIGSYIAVCLCCLFNLFGGSICRNCGIFVRCWTNLKWEVCWNIYHHKLPFIMLVLICDSQNFAIFFTCFYN